MYSSRSIVGIRYCMANAAISPSFRRGLPLPPLLLAIVARSPEGRIARTLQVGFAMETIREPVASQPTPEERRSCRRAYAAFLRRRARNAMATRPSAAVPPALIGAWKLFAVVEQ